MEPADHWGAVAKALAADARTRRKSMHSTPTTVDITSGTTAALNYKVPDIAFVEH